MNNIPSFSAAILSYYNPILFSSKFQSKLFRDPVIMYCRLCKEAVVEGRGSTNYIEFDSKAAASESVLLLISHANRAFT